MEQFQLEAAVRNRRTLATRTDAHTLNSFSEDTLAPRVTELLFGLTIRGWLSDRDKEFIDSLIGEQEITFLLCDGVCLHPEGIPHLPLDQIESAHRCGGEATFAQRHIVEEGRDRLAFRVRTAGLGQIAGHEVIFGSLGRERRDEQYRTDTRFSSVLNCFRHAAAGLEDLLASAAKTNRDDLPALFVNRSSGRILAVNASARQQFGLDDTSLVGCEFGEARSRLSDLLTTCTIRMRNVRSGDFDLGVIMILPESDSLTREPMEMPQPAFAHTIRNKIRSIAAAASHLESILGRDPGNSVAELVRIIREEAADLDRHAWRQQLVAEYSELPKAPASPVAELKSAVDIVSTWRKQCRIMLFEDTVDGCRVNCPHSSLLLLFEALLRSHLTSNPGTLESKITVRSGHTDAFVSVVVKTAGEPGPAPLQFHPDWRQYTERLAAVMEIDVNYSLSSVDNSLETQITMK